MSDRPQLYRIEPHANTPIGDRCSFCLGAVLPCSLVPDTTLQQIADAWKTIRTGPTGGDHSPHLTKLLDGLVNDED